MIMKVLWKEGTNVTDYMNFLLLKSIMTKQNLAMEIVNKIFADKVLHRRGNHY